MSDFSDEEFPSDDDDDSEGKERDVVEDAARQDAMDKLIPPLDPSEYGRMPAWFHSNSQKMAPATLEAETAMETQPSINTIARSDVEAAGKPSTRPMRRPILTRDKFDGVDSDDETDSEEERGEGGESDEDQPQVVGDVEIDMKEEEEEFLEFARQALGIDDKAWVDIIKDRTDRGGEEGSLICSAIRKIYDRVFSVPSKGVREWSTALDEEGV